MGVKSTPLFMIRKYIMKSLKSSEHQEKIVNRLKIPSLFDTYKYIMLNLLIHIP